MAQTLPVLAVHAWRCPSIIEPYLLQWSSTSPPGCCACSNCTLCRVMVCSGVPEGMPEAMPARNRAVANHSEAALYHTQIDRTVARDAASTRHTKIELTHMDNDDIHYAATAACAGHAAVQHNQRQDSRVTCRFTFSGCFSRSRLIRSLIMVRHSSRRSCMNLHRRSPGSMTCMQQLIFSFGCKDVRRRGNAQAAAVLHAYVMADNKSCL